MLHNVGDGVQCPGFGSACWSQTSGAVIPSSSSPSAEAGRARVHGHRVKRLTQDDVGTHLDQVAYSLAPYARVGAGDDADLPGAPSEVERRSAGRTSVYSRGASQHRERDQPCPACRRSGTSCRRCGASRPRTRRRRSLPKERRRGSVLAAFTDSLTHGGARHHTRMARMVQISG